MSHSISDVVGVVELELNADEFRVWLEGEEEITLPAPAPARFRLLPTSSTVYIADAEQLTSDLHSELLRMLQKWHEKR